MDDKQLFRRAFGENDVPAAYEDLKNTIISHFDPRVWFMTETCLSVICSIMLKDLSNPVGLNLVDSPASAKTTVLSFFYGLPWVFRCDDFSPVSFVSQAAGVSKKKLADVDLLPKIKNKCLLIPELAPLFGAEKAELQRNFSMLTCVFDGEGLVRHGGVHGTRGYEGTYMFTWLGATTPIKPYVWNLMGHLGSRMTFLTANTTNNPKTETALVAEGLTGDVTYRQKVKTCREAVKSYFETMLYYYKCEAPIPTLDWNRGNDPPEVIDLLTRLAEFAARSRSTVAVWKSDEYQREEMDFTQPSIEHSWRLAAVLYGIARGHAIISGRSQINEQDMPIIVEIAFSSMPDDRRRIIDALIANKGFITSTLAEDKLGFSRPSARKLMHIFKILEIGEFDKGAGNFPSELRLNKEYQWILGEEIREYRKQWSTNQATGEQIQEQEIPF